MPTLLQSGGSIINAGDGQVASGACCYYQLYSCPAPGEAVDKWVLSSEGEPGGWYKHDGLNYHIPSGATPSACPGTIVTVTASTEAECEDEDGETAPCWCGCRFAAGATMSGTITEDRYEWDPGNPNEANCPPTNYDTGPLTTTWTLTGTAFDPDTGIFSGTITRAGHLGAASGDFTFTLDPDCLENFIEVTNDAGGFEGFQGGIGSPLPMTIEDCETVTTVDSCIALEDDGRTHIFNVSLTITPAGEPCEEFP